MHPSLIFVPDVTWFMACSNDESDEEDEDGSENGASRAGLLAAGVDAQARKLAAQAVIDLSDKLARAQQDNRRLRQRLQDARRLSKVTRHCFKSSWHACRVHPTVVLSSGRLTAQV
jgi:hypothetical protein